MTNLYSTFLKIKPYNNKGDSLVMEYDSEKGIRFSMINKDIGLLCEAKMHDKKEIRNFLKRNYPMSNF